MNLSQFAVSTDAGSNLFLLMFALCAAETLSGTLPSMFNLGVGIIVKHGIWRFLVRGGFIFLFFALCSVAFIFGLQFSLLKEVKGLAPSILHVFVICVMSMSPWFCDHLARLCFLPARKIIRIREPEFKHVDIIFVGIYTFLIFVLLLIWKSVT